MDVLLQQVGKRYPSGWVVKDATHHFTSSSITGIAGHNGSGKSTLLRIISSLLTPDEGSVIHSSKNQEIKKQDVAYKVYHIAPDISLVNRLTIAETLHYHFQFRSLQNGLSTNQLLDLIWLQDVDDKQLSMLSSGMLQRLQLGLAFFTASDLILLDEPTSNLDDAGIELFNHLLSTYRHNRTVIIASNEQRDFIQCDSLLQMNQWK